jgi:hypothetical protein
MAQGGKPKNRTCETCGKSLHISDYFKGGTVCLDCIWAENCGIECIDCGGVFRAGAFKVSADGTYRNKTCNACCDSRVYGEGRSKETTSKKQKCAKCDCKAVDWFRGEYLCYDHLNPSETRSEMLERLIADTSMVGNGFEAAAEEKPKFECTTIVHRVNRAKRKADTCQEAR